MYLRAMEHSSNLDQTIHNLATRGVIAVARIEIKQTMVKQENKQIGRSEDGDMSMVDSHINLRAPQSSELGIKSPY